MKEIRELVSSISSRCHKLNRSRALLVGMSGIDASGKGFVSKELADLLETKNLTVAQINADGWLNLPHVRFSQHRHVDHGHHFYENALRLDEMFERLILPLKQNRSINLTADFAEETAADFRPHNYVFNDIDIILLEGIFLFKPSYVDYFDLKVWVECGFETAMKRAIRRSQEGLTEVETVTAYESIYFPAQRLHFLLDSPQRASDLILQNDEKPA
jgi:uridine kinase